MFIFFGIGLIIPEWKLFGTYECLSIAVNNRRISAFLKPGTSMASFCDEVCDNYFVNVESWLGYITYANTKPKCTVVRNAARVLYYGDSLWQCAVLHVTVCQFDVNSGRSRSGTITSPNYPGLYPRNIDCRYVFHGLQHDNHVTVNFTQFDVEGLSPAWVIIISLSSFICRIATFWLSVFCLTGFGIARVRNNERTTRMLEQVLAGRMPFSSLIKASREKDRTIHNMKTSIKTAETRNLVKSNSWMTAYISRADAGDWQLWILKL